MYDPTFTEKTLDREFIKADFSADTALADTNYRQMVVQRAQLTANAGFTNLRLKKSRLRGKDVYQLATLSDKLILRRVTRSIEYLSKSKTEQQRQYCPLVKGIARGGSELPNLQDRYRKIL